MKGNFRHWVEKFASHQNMTLDDVAEWARIPLSRWNVLMRRYDEPTPQEAEDVATEAFRLTYAEAYGNSDANIAAEFRQYLEARRPSEFYNFRKLWPILKAQFGYRLNGQSPDVIQEAFQEVLEDFKDDKAWPSDESVPTTSR